MILNPKKVLNTVILLRIRGYHVSFSRHGITIKRGKHAALWDGKTTVSLQF